VKTLCQGPAGPATGYLPAVDSITRAGAVQLRLQPLIADFARRAASTLPGLLPAHPVLGHQEPILQKLLPTVTALLASRPLPAAWRLAMPRLRKLDPSERRQQLIRNVKSPGCGRPEHFTVLGNSPSPGFFSRHLSPRSAGLWAVSTADFNRCCRLKAAVQPFGQPVQTTRKQASKRVSDRPGGFVLAPRDAVPKILDKSVSLARAESGPAGS